MLKKINKKNILILLAGIIAGGAGGYIYYIKIGCVSGTCPITSNPWITILWGMLLGYLLADLFIPRKKKSVEKT